MNPSIGWSAEEDEILRENQKLTNSEMFILFQKHGFDKTFGAIRKRRSRMGWARGKTPDGKWCDPSLQERFKLLYELEWSLYDIEKEMGIGRPATNNFIRVLGLKERPHTLNPQPLPVVNPFMCFR